MECEGKGFVGSYFSRGDLAEEGVDALFGKGVLVSWCWDPRRGLEDEVPLGRLL